MPLALDNPGLSAPLADPLALEIPGLSAPLDDPPLALDNPKVNVALPGLLDGRNGDDSPFINFNLWLLDVASVVASVLLNSASAGPERSASSMPW